MEPTIETKIIGLCAWCKEMSRPPSGDWRYIGRSMYDLAHQAVKEQPRDALIQYEISHGICPACTSEQFRVYRGKES